MYQAEEVDQSLKILNFGLTLDQLHLPSFIILPF